MDNFSPAKFDHGVVFVFDLLGFGGIWKLGKTHQIIESLEAVHNLLDTSFRLHNDMAKKMLLHYNTLSPEQKSVFANAIGARRLYSAKFLSDTIFVAAHSDEPLEEHTSGDRAKDVFFETSLQGIRHYIVAAMLELASGSFPFAIRGSVAVGDIIVRDHVIVGPAVDEAASFYEIADGAFVIACPSVLKVYERLNHSHDDAKKDLMTHMMSYDVPLRDGRVWRTRAVNPFFGPIQHPTQIAATLLAPFERNSSNLAVDIKRRNTKTFYEQAKCHWIDPTGAARA